MLMHIYTVAGGNCVGDTLVPDYVVNARSAVPWLEGNTLVPDYNARSAVPWLEGNTLVPDYVNARSAVVGERD